MIRYNHTNLRMTAMLAVLLVLGAAFAPLGHAQSPAYSIRVENNSSYAIYKVYLPSTSRLAILTGNWGPDLLGTHALSSGYFFTIAAESGTYDLRLVDQDGDTCIVPRVAVDGDTTWRITNIWLLACQWRTSHN